MIGDTLKALREKAGLSQSKFAKEYGINAGTLASYELGKREPNINTLKRFSEIYGVSVDYLIGNTIIEKHYEERQDELDRKEINTLALNLFRNINDTFLYVESYYYDKYNLEYDEDRIQPPLELISIIYRQFSRIISIYDEVIGKAFASEKEMALIKLFLDESRASEAYFDEALLEIIRLIRPNSFNDLDE